MRPLTPDDRLWTPDQIALIDSRAGGETAVHRSAMAMAAE